MFPLKRRRRFARIEQTLDVIFVFKGQEFKGTIEDVSASGCKGIVDNPKYLVEINDEVFIKFSLLENEFSLKAIKVRENGYKFIDLSQKELSVLNSIVLTEYFKDTPELMPVDKALDQK